MTRNRAHANGVPSDIMVEYYAQRAEAGLIVAEGTWPSAVGQAYCRQPGIETREHIAGWKRVTDAVHQRGGKIVLQIMHAGRIGSRWIKGDDIETVAPSAIRARGEVFTDESGMQPYDEPRALTTAEVKQLITEHGEAASRADEAGFDGVELHCTSGYLPMQFMCSGTNQRNDEFGGSVENRVRFPIDCLAAMGEAIGYGRVGFRIMVGNTFNDVSDEDTLKTHTCLLQGASRLGLAYAHIMRAADPALDAFALARSEFGGPLILNDGFDGDSAESALRQDHGEAVSFARHFIGNPDLVQRLRAGLALAKFDRKTLYTAGPQGYTDYPLAVAANG